VRTDTRGQFAIGGAPRDGTIAVTHEGYRGWVGRCDEVQGALQVKLAPEPGRGARPDVNQF